MFKNVAGQKVTVYAVDASTGLPKSGDAANITVYVSKDDGAATALTDTSATEADATNAKGDYLFDLSQAETNADKLRFTGKSTTSNVVIVPQTVYTTPANFSALAVDGTGKVTVGTNSDKTGYTASTVSDKTGYSITQAFPANFADMAITVTTGRVTAGTVSDKTGYSVSGTLTTLDALATHGDSAWPTATGFALASVWTSTLAAHLDAVYGKLPANNIADETLVISATSAILSAVGSPLQAGSYTAPLDAAGTRTAVGLDEANMDTQLNAIYTVAGLVQARTDHLPGSDIVHTLGKLWVLDGDGNAVAPASAVGTPQQAGSAVTLPAIPADWIAAAGVKADAVTKIQSGLATPTNITAGTITNVTNAPTAGDFTAAMKTSLSAATPAVTVSDKTGFALTGAYDFAKGTVAVTESYAANGAAPSPVQALLAIQQYLTQFVISSTAYTVLKLDGTTTAYVVTLNDAVSPTGANRT